jgi:hypothetical protein
MAAANSTEFRIKVGTTPVAIACQQETDFEVSSELVETSCKDTGSFAQFRPGKKSASANVSGIIMTPAGSADPATLLNAAVAGTLLTVEVSSSEAGVPALEGSCYVENYSQSGSGIGNPVTFSATLKFSGTFTVA